MDDLRLALLFVGIVVVVIVYWTARRRNAADVHNSEPGERVEPTIAGQSDLPLRSDTVEQPLIPSEPEPVLGDNISTVEESLPAEPASSVVPEVSESPAEPATPEPSEPETPDVPDKVVALRIVRKGGGEFAADEVILALREAGLQHGRFGIFHFPFEGSMDDTLFSAASLTEPGSFDLQDIKEKRLAGLSLFMVRPGPGRGVDAFDQMIKTSRAVTTAIAGELLDADGNALSIQRERFLRDEIVQYELDHLKFS